MSKLKPVVYKGMRYPFGIKSNILEIAAHFDSRPVISETPYSLHTEYSHGPRKFSSPACKGLRSISSSNFKGIPRLWFSKEWVNEFLTFVKRLVGNNRPPLMVEIHPPFKDYSSLTDFLDLYERFEEGILEIYPDTNVLIENRYGSRYRSKFNFVVSNVHDLVSLVDEIEKRRLKLRIALDIIQLFSSHGLNIGPFSRRMMFDILNVLMEIREYIIGIHLWGKCYGRGQKISPHMGTLTSYFKGLRCSEIGHVDFEHEPLKKSFLERLYEFLDDDVERFFVPEVNSKVDHFYEIVSDLLSHGFEFVE